MKFIHIADSHIGAWREPRLRDLSLRSFFRIVNDAIDLKVDFLLIAGDIFNTSIPSVDHLNSTVKALKQLKLANIPVYIIAGSHDCSPSGKTMLNVLESADLLVNVCKGFVKEQQLYLNFTIDEKTGVKITGVPGKRGMLDRKWYEKLVRSHLEEEGGFKIFLFHTSIDELKPKDLEMMESSPASLLPKGFDYYAGGHVHIVNKVNIEGYKNLVYPGPLFPTNFAEIEKLGFGGYYLYEDENLEFIPIILVKHQHISLDVKNKSSFEIHEYLLKEIEGKNWENTIITIRCTGLLSTGKLSDINFDLIFKKLYSKGAYAVMKSTRGITLPLIERPTENSTKLGYLEVEMMHILNTEKQEGERVIDFEERIIESALAKLLNS